MYDIIAINTNIRKVFCDIRLFDTNEEYIPESASLLNIANFTNDSNKITSRLLSYTRYCR